MIHISAVTKTLVLCLACVSSSLLAQSAQQSEIAELDRLLSGIETMAADVIQVIVESNGGILEESSIRMYLQKPNGFYWETLEPFPELVVTDGDRLWNYQPDLEQVVVEDWNSDRSELAAQLLNGQTDSLAEEYRVELLPAEGSVVEFTLTPKASDSVYRRISISFAGQLLDTIHLQHKNGQQTVWRFSDVHHNQPLDASLFSFEPPAGIEVIENEYAQ